MSSSKKSGKKEGQKKGALTPQDEALQSILVFIKDTLYPLFSNEQVSKIIPRDEDMDKKEQMELAIQAASATCVRSVSLCTLKNNFISFLKNHSLKFIVSLYIILLIIFDYSSFLIIYNLIYFYSHCWI